MALLRNLVVVVLLSLVISIAGITWINLTVPEIWPLWLEPWSR